jgi:hypothetical protein
MPIENKYEVVAIDSPDRCQAVTGKGQCLYKAMTGSNYCPMHGGNKAQDSLKAASLKNYRLSKWQGRVAEFADNGAVKSLREEVGILRMVLEEMVSRCGDPVDLVLNSAKISDMVTKVEKLVVSCHRLESSLGMLLDKQAAMQLSGEIVDIITRHIKDDSAIASIANEIGIVFGRLGAVEPKD